MDTIEALKFLPPLFRMKEKDILDKFANLSNKAVYTQPELIDMHSVFIPGDRKDRVLLVAHVDTVWNDSPKINVGVGENNHNILYSKTRNRGVDKDDDPYFDGCGIGADDRAGVGLLWLYRKFGHSLLLVNGEEHGTMGSRYLMSNPEMSEMIQDHQFAVEFDRQGYEDVVFYNVGTEKFKNYVKGETKYSLASGTNTDISVLCKKICGVNISIGYYSQHTPNEVLDVGDWLRTFKVAGNWLLGKNLPHYKL